MDTTNITQVPPIETVARIGATVQMTARDAMKFLRAIAHDPDGGTVVDYIESERLRISNGTTDRAATSEAFRQRVRSEAP